MNFELISNLRLLPEMASRVTLHHNAGDKADYTKHNPGRHGAACPRNSRKLPDKVCGVDCKPVVTDFPGHQFYRLNDIVRKDVLAVLNGTPNQEIQTRNCISETESYNLHQINQIRYL